MGEQAAGHALQLIKEKEWHKLSKQSKKEEPGWAIL